MNRNTLDSLGQVKSGKKYWPDWTPVAGQQFEYGFDDIGNRTGTKTGGDEHGANLRSAAYGANSLNQYTNRDVPGAVDIMGDALATNSVLVNGNTPYRRGEYFRDELSVDNSSAPVWQSITVSATGETNVTGHLLVPRTPEQFGYDVDGNLTSDGHWGYTWDTECRLVGMTTIGSIPQEAQMSLSFDYDYKGRRYFKQAGSSARLFVYDGWNLLAELDSNVQQPAVIRSYLWGLDLSGSPQGAGGVGGLLAVSDPSTLNSQPSTHFAAYDGNGNVTALVNAAGGEVSARYEYGPFGEVIRATGPMAKANPFRFSTKYQDDETDLLYYGYRYYNAGMGRWLSRDPLEEPAFRLFRHSKTSRAKPAQAAVRLYIFCDNAAINSIDYFGLCGFGQDYAKLHPGPTVTNAIHSPKGGEGLCCRMRIDIPKGHSDFTGADQFHFENYDIENPPIPICGDPGPHFGDREKVRGDLNTAVTTCDVHAFSNLMHQLQDTYCHEGFTWDPCHCKFGHAWESITGRDPDTLSNENGQWDKAEAETKTWVERYNSNCPYEVVGPM